MRARSLDAGRFDGAREAVARGVVGMGEPLARLPGSISEALLATAAEHGDKASRMLLRFAELDSPAFFWTMTGPETWRLGELDGPWRYDQSDAARQTGIRNVRPAVWLEREFGAAGTPAGVLQAFARGGLNMQRIRDGQVAADTREILANSG